MGLLCGEFASGGACFDDKVHVVAPFEMLGEL